MRVWIKEHALMKKGRGPLKIFSIISSYRLMPATSATAQVCTRGLKIQSIKAKSGTGVLLPSSGQFCARQPAAVAADFSVSTLPGERFVECRRCGVIRRFSADRSDQFVPRMRIDQGARTKLFIRWPWGEAERRSKRKEKDEESDGKCEGKNTRETAKISEKLQNAKKCERKKNFMKNV